MRRPRVIADWAWHRTHGAVTKSRRHQRKNVPLSETTVGGYRIEAWHLMVPGPVVAYRMQYRRLGRTDMTVSAMSFGAWAIGGSWGSVDDAQSMRALHAAIDAGV